MSQPELLFYPDAAPVPSGLATPEFVLEPLRTTHVQLDYAALMDSKAMLRLWSQSDWPADDFTLDANYQDLDEHEREHVERVAFTYTVLSPDRQTCLGCVYIQPLAPVLDQGDLRQAPQGGRYRGRTAFWVRQSRLADELDRRLLAALVDWFERDWAFERMAFYTNAQNERQVQILSEAGFQERYSVEGRSANGQQARLEVFV